MKMSIFFGEKDCFSEKCCNFAGRYKSGIRHDHPSSPRGGLSFQYDCCPHFAAISKVHTEDKVKHCSLQVWTFSIDFHVPMAVMQY